MGSGVVKPIPKIPPTTANLEISCHSSYLITDGVEVIYNNEACDHVQNTFFSNEPIELREGKQLQITVIGGVVMRVGLTNKNPKTNDFVKNAIFEEEDGFGPGTSHRSLYLNHINYLCYGEPGAEREYLHLEQGPVWMYIVVIYGSPNISAVYESRKMYWACFDKSNIRFADNETTAECYRVSEAGNLITTDPIQLRDTYMLRWDMHLERCQPAGKPLQYGFIRVALVDSKPIDIDDLQLKDSGYMDKSVLWCVDSAIHDYPFSGTLAFQLDIEEREITHNAMLSSVDHVTNARNLDIRDIEELYLVVELSSGSLKIEHGPNDAVRQSYGSIVYLKNCKELSSETAIRYKVAASGHDPCMILYGSDPTSFVIEFRDRFSLDEISIPELTKTMEMLTETNTIQVLGVPQHFERFELDNFFSRESACGGDRIVHIRQSNMVNSTWIIQYENTRVTRRVLRRKSYSIEGIIVHVLPYYAALGCAINRGKKPYLDLEPFSIHPKEMLDGCQIVFFVTRADEIEKLQRHMAKVKVELNWAQSESGCDCEETDKINMKCLIPHHEHSKLITWKDDAKAKLKRYFDDNLCEKNIEINKDRWEFSLTRLYHLSEHEKFEFVSDENSHTVRLVTTKQTNLERISSEIINIVVPCKWDTITLTRERSEKYLTLEAENKTQDLRKIFKAVRICIDYNNRSVYYSGPASEVSGMHAYVLNLMLNVKVISLTESDRVIKIAEKKKKELTQNINSCGFKGPVKISGKSISVSVFCTRETDLDVKRELLRDKIRMLIKKCTIFKPDKSYFTENDFNVFKEKAEQRYESILSYDKKNNNIKVCAWFNDIKLVTEELKHFISLHEKDVETMIMKQDAAEYLDQYNVSPFDIGHWKVSFENRGDYYTGFVCTKGDINTRTIVKSILPLESAKVNSMWLTISKPWLASLIEELPLHRIAKEHKCIISVDNSKSLAKQGIRAVSILTTNWTVVKVVTADTSTLDTEAVVSIANNDLTPTTEMASAIFASGGSTINNECMSYIAKHGNVKKGQAIVTWAGQLSYRAIIHAVGPQLKTSDSRADQRLLETTIKHTLQSAEKEGLGSLSIPRFVYSMSHENIAGSCEIIVKAVKDHLESYTGNRSLTSIYLCDEREEIIDEFIGAMEKTLHSGAWTFFKHRLAVNDEDSQGSSRAQNLSNLTLEEPGTSGDGQETLNGVDNVNDDIRWNPSISVQLSSDTVDEATGFGEKAEDPFKDGLPFKIKISKKFRLNIVKGRLEQQMVDVLVCPTFEFPDLDGAVADAIKNAAGPDLEQACRQIQSLEFGQVERVKSGTLSCQEVYIFKIRKSLEKETFTRVNEYVKTSLKIAADSDYTSIAFPTIGTGRRGYPADDVAEAMLSAIVDFGTRSPATSLRNVFVVVCDQDFGTIGIFEIWTPTFFELEINSHRSHNERKDMSHLYKTNGNGVKIAKYTPISSNSKHNQVDDFVLVKFITQTACQVLERTVHDVMEKHFTERSIPFYFDNEEDRLSNDESEMVRILANRFKIIYSIETADGKPLIKITGLKAEVDRALPNFHDLVIQKIPDVRMKKKMAGSIARYVQWLYDDSGTQIEVKQDYNLELYMGYIRGENFKYRNEGIEFEVNVADLEEYPVNNPSKKRRLYLRNKVLKGITIPSNWKIVLTGDMKYACDLDPTDKEFQDVKAEFINAGCRPTTILKIVRIENKTLWMQYQSKKEQMNKQNKSQDNERMLWHGTKADAADVIIERGYDRGFVNVHVHGRGTYFAVTSIYSQSYATPDANGVQRMFYNDVLTGCFTTVAREDATLPIRIQTQNEVILYDSAVDNVNNPNMFIIFHDTQAYPRYMIEFKL